MKIAALIVVALLLGGCSGGSGGGAIPIPPAVVPLILSPGTFFGYFGVLGTQLAETAKHVNLAYCMDWSDWDDKAAREWMANTIIAQLTEAKTLGIPNSIVAVGFLTFTKAYAYRGTADLIAFRDRCKAAGLAPTALSILDEPDVYGVSDALLTQACNEIRTAWPGPKMAVIYGQNRRYPGVAAFDWAGMDHYGVDVFGNGDVADLKAHLRPEQRLILVAGGASPWKESPQPFVKHANLDSQVAAIIGFIYGDGWGDDPTNVGIEGNGMLAQYASILGAKA